MSSRTAPRWVCVLPLVLAATLLLAPSAAAQSWCEEPVPRFHDLRICPERTVPEEWSRILPPYEAEEAELATRMAQGNNNEVLQTPFTCRTYPIGTDQQTAADVTFLITPREAVESGLNPGQLSSYERDLKSLTLADPAVVAARKKHDAAMWQPPSSRGWFAEQIIEIKLFWDLTVDQAEADALADLLRTDASRDPNCDANVEPVPVFGPVGLGALCALLIGIRWKQNRRRRR